MDQRRTIFGHSTMQAITRAHRTKAQQLPDMRHAMVVVNRMIRSADNCDQAVQERLDRAVGFLKVTQQSAEPSYSQRPKDLVFCLAARILRSLRM